MKVTKAPDMWVASIPASSAGKEITFYMVTDGCLSLNTPYTNPQGEVAVKNPFIPATECQLYFFAEPVVLVEV